MKLYGADICPFVHRVRLVLAEKNLEHEYVAIDLANKPDWYHEVLPTGRVPLLEDGNYRIWESDVLCEYLEEAYPSTSLMPISAGEKAQVRLQVGWSSNRFIPLFYKLLAIQDEAQRAALKDDFQKVFEDLEERLNRSDSPYFFSQLSLADTALYPWFERFCVLEHYRDFSVPSGLPNLARWLHAMKERESVKQLAIDKAYFIAGYRSYADGSRVPS